MAMNGTQMSTPINSLPLKTTQDDTTIDDPLIQNVLKEFEDEFKSKEPQEPEVPQSPPPIVPEEPRNTIVQPIVKKDHLKYNNHKSKLIDLEIVKKSIIITILILLLQKENIMSTISKYIPQILGYVEGKELIFYSFIVSVIIYTIYYFDLI